MSSESTDRDTGQAAGQFAGRSAFVTGAGSGIGAAVAARLAREGAAVAATDVDLEAASATAYAIRRAGGRAEALAVDVADPRSVDTGVAAAVAAFGGLHLAVNCAGIGGPAGLTADCTAQDWRRILDVDLDGVFYCLRAQIPAMIAAGGGAIVTISSLAGERACVGMAPYVTAKHGVRGLTQTAAMEYGPQGVRVNAVAPGWVDTPMLAPLGDAGRAAVAATLPLGRLGTVEDVSEACVFLLSPRASMITGLHLLVDGGLSLL